jgi:tRNA-splicing ligase RtcB (3'-phosphate/5'-hydroxy nucleic acid ligase)
VAGLASSVYIPLRSASARACPGLHQVGSLGSGNHLLEVQIVDRVVDEAAAAALGLHQGPVCVMIHSGSRGLGHQICTDHVRRMERAMARYGIHVADRQLACVPVGSLEGEAYFAAMAAAADYGRANRQLLAAAARRAFATTVESDRLELVYDVSHNLAKLEDHEVGGRSRRLCVHRKGATRALPPGHPDLPPDLATVGQPVLVPGSIGTASHVLVGVTGGAAFHSTCQGAGRTMSRTAARRRVSGAALQRELESAGIAVRAGSSAGAGRGGPVLLQGRRRRGRHRRAGRPRPAGRTLAGGGRPDPAVLEALDQVRARGVRVLLVTGRILACGGDVEHVVLDEVRRSGLDCQLVAIAVS